MLASTTFQHGKSGSGGGVAAAAPGCLFQVTMFSKHVHVHKMNALFQYTLLTVIIGTAWLFSVYFRLIDTTLAAVAQNICICIFVLTLSAITNISGPVVSQLLQKSIMNWYAKGVGCCDHTSK